MLRYARLKSIIITTLLSAVLVNSVSAFALADQGKNSPEQLFTSVKNVNQKVNANLDDELLDQITAVALEKNLGQGEIEKLVKEKANAKAEYVKLLVANGADSEKVKKIKDRDLEDVANIVVQEKLTKEQVKTLTDSWVDVGYTNLGVTVEEPEVPLPNQPIAAPMNNLENTELTQSSVIQPLAVTTLGSTINSSLYTGVHYQITSNMGYNKASGTYQLPSVYIGNAGSTNPDVPYSFFGHYTDSQTIGFDAGVFYKNGTWKFFLGGYALRKLVNTSTGSVTWDWSTAGLSAARVWKELSTTYTPSQISKVYMVSKYERFTNNEKITITYTNAVTWSVIGSLEFDTAVRESKYLLNPTSGYTAQAVQLYTSGTSMSNLYLNREVTIAWNSDSTRLPNTGTTVTNAKWSDVNIYNTVGYGLWDSNKTMRAEERARTQSFLNSINPTITSQWYADSVNILFTQP